MSDRDIKAWLVSDDIDGATWIAYASTKQRAGDMVADGCDNVTIERVPNMDGRSSVEWVPDWEENPEEYDAAGLSIMDTHQDAEATK